MAENKNQHYVPQFYLRNFSVSKKSLSAYLLKEGKFIPNAGISGQCSHGYFYGEDLLFENLLSGFESEFASSIKRYLESSASTISFDDQNCLKIFLSIQSGRTEKVAAFAKDSIQFAADKIASAFKSFNDDCDIGITLMRAKNINLAAQSVLYSTAFAPALNDLRIHKITNHTSVPFITSDNPVTLVNPYCSNSPASIGTALKGIQILAPLSPNCLLFAFDNDIYAPLETNGKFETALKDVLLVKRLNQIAAFSSSKILFSTEDASKSDFEDAAQAVLNYDSSFTRINEFSRIDGDKVKQRFGLIPPPMPQSLTHGYYIPRYKRRNSAPIVPRDPKLTFYLNKFAALVMEGKYPPTHFEEFLQDVT